MSQNKAHNNSERKPIKSLDDLDKQTGAIYFNPLINTYLDKVIEFMTKNGTQDVQRLQLSSPCATLIYSAHAEENFKAVNQANDILSDLEKRARFDRGEIDANGHPTRNY